MKTTSLEQEFMRRYPTRKPILRLMQEAIGVSEVRYEHMTLTNLEEVRRLMLERLSQNSAQVYCAIIKSFLNAVSEDVELPTMRFAKVLRVRGVPSQHCALTEEELMRIDEYTPATEAERDAKILFMRGALTGARSSDCRVMSTDNLRNGTLSYVSVKTKIAVEQPIHRRLMKYLTMQPKEHDQKVINRCIQGICKKLGFDEPVTLSRNGRMVTKKKYEWMSMHAARRTFCTDLAVRGVPVEVIAKLAGHANSATTSSRYICVDTKKLGQEAMSFFNA